MPLANLNLEVTVVASGSVYPGWEAIEIWREYNSVFSYMKLRASEDTNSGSLPPAFSLAVGNLPMVFSAASR